jgi:hypothetical protein
MPEISGIGVPPNPRYGDPKPPSWSRQGASPGSAARLGQRYSPRTQASHRWAFPLFFLVAISALAYYLYFPSSWGKPQEQRSRQRLAQNTHSPQQKSSNVPRAQQSPVPQTTPSAPAQRGQEKHLQPPIESSKKIPSSPPVAETSPQPVRPRPPAPAPMPRAQSPRETPEVLCPQAQTLAKQNRWFEASRLMEQAVSLAPHALMYRKILALCLMRDSQYGRAIPELERVVREGGADAAIYRAMGQAYYQAGSYDKSVRAHQEAIRLEPGQINHLLAGTGRILEIYKKDPGYSSHLHQAEEWAARATELGGPPATLANMFHDLGHYFYQNGYYTDALRSFENAIRLDPNMAKHYKCGSRCIVEIYKRDPGFGRYLPLARDWANRAMQLGLPSGELVEVWRVLEMAHMRPYLFHRQ